MYRKALKLIKRAIRKPPGVIAFRVAQELRLRGMHVAGVWPRLERSIRRTWDSERVLQFADRHKDQLLLVATDAVAALNAAVQAGWVNKNETLVYGCNFQQRRFELLGVPVPSTGPLPWSTDWRWDKVWAPSYFKNYNFYGARTVPYDVKVPWELSRLGFVLPILQNAALDSTGVEWVDTAVTVVQQWERDNPLAYTVSWNPMEASVRGIYLILGLEMLLAVGETRPEVLSPYLRLITAHGEFAWNALEYTDVRGNHYAANIVFLFLAGLTLGEYYPRATAWLKYATRAIPTEVGLQYAVDGVNFEKSVPYHRLVTELFLLALIAAKRAGVQFPTAVADRLQAACRYSAAYTRPDGLSPNWGDNDDARLFCLTPAALRDHRPLIGVGAALFNDAHLKAIAKQVPTEVCWFLGNRGLTTWATLPAAQTDGTTVFQAGGMVAVRSGENFLLTDVGEVGLAGRGGHGHNDLLSLELVLSGIPLVVDPGSYVYTADEKARNLFRSTAYHNSLRIDGAEIAPMYGLWSIGSHAVPCDVSVIEDGPVTVIRAGHRGYMRLDDPVRHCRELRFTANLGIVDCRDQLECSGVHTVERFLHFDIGIKVELAGSCAVASGRGKSWIISWPEGTQSVVDEGWISPGYGQRDAGAILILRDQVNGSSELDFRIQPV